MKEYQSFIEGKVMDVPKCGFHWENFHKNTFPHQKDTVQWALFGGNRAIFSSFGLGKTIVQLEIAKAVISHTGKPFLIGLPLGVVGEFKDDAKNILDLEIHYTTDQRHAESIQADYDSPQIFISNYDRIREEAFDPTWFGGCSFDEGDVIRNLDTKTSDYMIHQMTKIPHRFIATATPDPNEITEILNYAHFLGICDRDQALTRFFKRDSTKAGNLTLHEHKVDEFWLWVSSWAIFLEKPSDLGYNDEGYDLPKLNIVYHEINNIDRGIKYDRDGRVLMFDDASKSLQSAAKEKQESLFARCEKAVEIIEAHPDSNFIIWHDLENERKALEALLKGKDFKSVFGSQKTDIKEEYLNGFKNGEYQYLLTKPSIAGSGCNFQKHCADAVFVGIGWKFKDFIQAIHRILRFRQFKEVTIHLVYTDAELKILKDLERKWAQHKETQSRMTEIMRKYGLSKQGQIEILKRSSHVERMELKGKDFRLIRNDCVVELANRKPNSIQMFLSSFPFADQYEYCELYQDFGHNNGNDEFFKQCDFLVPEMYRTLEPGRIAAIHVKNRIQFSYQNGVGFTSLIDFRGKVVQNFEKHGFYFLGEHYIVTDVVRENNQTYRLGWTENCKDGTKMGAGSPEYLLIFRKPPSDTSNAYADNPVQKYKGDSLYVCNSCDHQTEDLKNFKEISEKEIIDEIGYDAYDSGTGSHRCEKCKKITSFRTVKVKGYSRGRWQMDAHSLWRSNGNRILTSDELRKLDLGKIGKWWKDYLRNEPYDFENHIEICETLDKMGKLPSSFMALAPWVHLNNDAVWDDVNRMNTLNTQQANRKKEQHLCPLQFDIVDRAIDRYSNPGDVVYDPFGGLGTSVLRAVKKGRIGESTELHELYWRDSCQYLKEFDYQRSVPTLFDMAV